MKTGLNQAAYTIIEILIVLAVTGALVLSVMFVISGQQGRTEFNQAINDIQAQINDVINNVSTGYYANNGNVGCAAGASGPVFSTVGQNQGTNQGCVFMGRGIQFAVGNDPNLYNIYDIAGLREYTCTQIEDCLGEASPTAIAPPHGADTTQQQRLQYGLEAAQMYFTDSGADVPVNTVTFMSTLANSSNGNLASGSQQVELRPVQNTTDISTSGDKSATAAVTAINAANLDLVPDGGVTICFNSGSSNQSGTITIGSNGRQLSTKLVINSGLCGG